MGNTSIKLESITLQFPQIEPIPLTPESSAEHLESYPYPYLQIGTGTQTQQLEMVVLENDWVRFAFVPELGGRIFQIVDKRTQTDILTPPETLTERFHPTGKRGVELDFGLQIGHNRLGSLAPVDWSITESENEITLTLSETTSTLSWHAFYTLPKTHAGIFCEVRVVNRTFSPQSWNRNLLVDSKFPLISASEGFQIYGEQNGFAICFDKFVMANQPFELAPLQADSYGFWIMPFSNLTSPVSASPLGVLSLEEAYLLQPAQYADSKIFVQTHEGETFEANVSLNPNENFSAPLKRSDLTQTAIYVDGELQLFYPWAQPSSSPSLQEARMSLLQESDASEAEVARRDIGSASAAYILKAMELSRHKKFAEAIQQIENAINVNGENPIFWWIHAALNRTLGKDQGEALPNAHFLAPLEPLLRAEAFLSSATYTEEPSPLIQPIANHPEVLCEIAGWLSDFGLNEDLSKWVDEVQRHRPLPLLNYLLAVALLRHTRMAVEAAGLIQLVANSPIQPPYPARDNEILAIQKLAAHFPDPRLQDLAQLVEKVKSQQGLGNS